METPEVYVMVVGETARAHNFSLYGYPRDTNPLLSKTQGIKAFPNLSASQRRELRENCTCSSPDHNTISLPDMLAQLLTPHLIRKLIYMPVL